MSVGKRSRGRPHKSGGWQQLSVRMADEWSKACGLLPERHKTNLAELLSDAIAKEPLKAVQVLSGYIPRNIDVTLNAEGTLAEALGRASQLMIEADAQVIEIERENKIDDNIIAQIDDKTKDYFKN